MNTPKEQRRIELEYKNQMKNTQTEVKPTSYVKNIDRYSDTPREESSLHPLTQDERFYSEFKKGSFKSEKTNIFKTKALEFYHCFAVLALVFGLVFVFVTPPMTVPDEYTHFLKCYSLSELRLFPRVENGVVTDQMDSDVLGFVREFNKLTRPNSNSKTSIDYIGMWNSIFSYTTNKSEQMTYPTVNDYIVYYLPQTLGVAIARLFGMPVLWMLYMGRLFNLFFYVAMMYLAIKTTPICKNLFALLALLPMALFLAASLSYDVMVISVCAVFVAEILNLCYNPKVHFTKEYFIKILILSIMLLFLKTMYFLLVLLILAIPFEKFNAKKERICVFVQIVILSLITFGIVTIIRKNIFSGVVSDNSMTVNQIINVLHNPIDFLKVILNTFLMFKGKFAKEFIGVFGWLDIFLPKWLIALYYFGLIGALFEMNETEIGFIRNNSFSDTIILFILTLIVSVGFTVLLVAVFYYILTLVTLKMEGATAAYGIQGRYFIPIAYPALSALAALINYKFSFDDKFYQFTKIFNVGLVIVAQVVSIVAIAMRYYIF